MTLMSQPADAGPGPIAVIGMACRFPGATELDAFWQNMRTGVESVDRYTAAQLIESGVSPGTVHDSDYRWYGATLDDADCFDAEFFGFSPREAAIMDPQQRVFCECAWEAVENSGHDPLRLDVPTGVFAGCFVNKYLTVNLLTNADFLRSDLAETARILNDKDFLATRVAYLLNLKGPAVTLQTACSTSLVAVHFACQSLWNYESDIALAGGATINIPLASGYRVTDGGLFSPEGQCRPFDADARGTVPGSGAAVIVLRRLQDAMADNDHIWAVIKGSAVNNDGHTKVGFTAPSVTGQAEVITAAQEFAGVDPATIGYIEAHGTGTRVGDPIEFAALTECYSRDQGRASCALGSVKANIGHLDAAAGVAGLMRAVLALYHAEIPPAANFRTANPELDIDHSPFYFPRAAGPWRAQPGSPRRAGASSFGVGGTNAHVVLEEAPSRRPPGPVPRHPRRWQLLTLAARNRGALNRAAGKLADYLEHHPELDLGDVAFTLQEGRHHFPVRQGIACRDLADGAQRLRRPDRVAGQNLRQPTAGSPQVIFAFPGVGTQHAGMAREVYKTEPSFRQDIDACAGILQPLMGWDLRERAFGSGQDAALDPLDVPAVLVSIFAVEYALARLWISWGVRPAGLIGHSLGEYAAACIAGVFSLHDALDLTASRGRLMMRIPDGRMLAVALGEAAARSRLSSGLSIAAVNAPSLTAVSGVQAEVDALARRLAAEGISCQEIRIGMASHSPLVEPHLQEFTRIVEEYPLKPPEIPLISGVTGTWMTDEEAIDPRYWARHLRQPVRFADGLRLITPGQVLLEVGPGSTLTRLVAAQHLPEAPPAIASLPRPGAGQSELQLLIEALAKLWEFGIAPDFTAVRSSDSGARIPLPGYPFERRRHWVQPGDHRELAAAGAQLAGPVTLSGTTATAMPPTASDAAEAASPTERLLAGIWRDLLGIDEIQPADDFFDLGGHSLMATQMMTRIRRETGIRLVVRDLVTSSTLSGLAQTVDARRADHPVATRAAREDLIAEVELDPRIRAEGLPPARQPAAHAFLTGGTGFLGAALCAELLRRTTLGISCLVRAGDPATGLARIRDKLAAIGVPADHMCRIEPVVGDLAEPLLGLGQAKFEDLATRIDLIYHCGANVNFTRPYRSLKAANVSGTQEILRLATTVRRLPVHYVSTLAVLAGALSRTAQVDEDGDLPPPVDHDTGYSESKWVAEAVTRLARKAGVPVSIYRPGIVLGDSRTGISNADDYITKMIIGCIELGLAPLRDYPLAVATVDYVSTALTELSQQPMLAGGTFHLISPEPLRWNYMFKHVKACGYRIESVPYEIWREELLRQLEHSPDNALAALGGMMTEAADRPMPMISVANTSAGLARTEIIPPTPGQDYFARVLGYFADQGWLSPIPTGRSQPAV